MAMSSPATLPVHARIPLEIPQDIIDLIIDEIASDLNGYIGNLNGPGSPMDTLKRCALVSRAFYFPSRRRIFSKLHLEFDMPNRNDEPRTRNLLKILERKESAHLLPLIRTVKSNFNLIPISRKSQAGNKYQQFIRGMSSVTQKFLPPTDNLVELYNLLSQAPLEKCVFTTEGGFFKWTISTFPALIPIQEMCTGQSLKVLHLVYVADLDQSLLIAILSSPNLRELVLSNVILSSSSEYHIDPAGSSRTLSNLETLGIVHVGKTSGSAIVPISFFTDLVPWFPGNNNSKGGSLKFRGLKRFSAHVARRGNRMSVMWQGILNAAETLQVLELQDNFRMVTNDPVFHEDGPFFLDRLKTLRKLLYWADALHTPFVDAVTALELKIQILANLLKTVASPLGLQTISVQLYMELSLPSRTNGLALFQNEVHQRTEKWSALDASMCNSLLYDLQEVEFDIKLFFCDSSYSSYEEIDEGPVDIGSLFPKLAARIPPVAIRVRLWSVFSQVGLNWYKK